MEKSYDPERFETRLYEWWEKSGFFKAEDESLKPPFTIVYPPPNVTGVLHNGHALTSTIQDTLIRWKRMCGYNALWLPGKDHAGIATQMVVERELAKEKKSRHDLGREEFLKRVWDWKEKNGNIISRQLRKMGSSFDWDREYFTMDANLGKVVTEVFVRLYEEKLLYRGARLINWCTRCQTALSDLEVVAKETKGKFWHIKYVLASDASKSITIATTRPETLLGDMAVAVHPDDERYKSWIGKKVKLPLMDREIPVIADEYVDKEFGSGGLKVTPGHDFNDYEIGLRHKLEILSVFDKTGKVNASGKQYAGLSIPEAREKVIADLTEQGLLVKVEDHVHSVGGCQRCERVVEPMMSLQWFLNVKPMAELAIEAMKKGEGLTLAEVDAREDAIKILPETWLSTYYHWMENIRDWCVSRQLWWGHQIPAWYCKDCDNVMVVREKPEFCCTKCGGQMIEQDQDVLDTWFSSALVTFSTLGWPEKTKALKTFYPTGVMETGFDILFFWVARMIMMGMHFNEGRVPFKRVYLHAMVRDEKGQKMSKTKGNVIDPLDIIKDYGADAFRFTLAAMAGQGRDVRLSLDRVEGYKGFCNKLWNASRYALMRLGHLTMDGMPTYPKKDFSAVKLDEFVEKNRDKFHPINQWIISRLESTTLTVNTGFEEFRLNESANVLYSFIWNEYCDWYIEFSKTLLENEATADETKTCLFYVLNKILALAHPIIPFVTEEIFQNLPKYQGKADALMMSTYPQVKNIRENKNAAMVDLWKHAIESLRTFRGENGIHPKLKPKVSYEVLADKALFEKGLGFIKSLSNLEELEIETGSFKGKSTTAEVQSEKIKFYIPLTGLVDVDGELKRLEKEKAATQKDVEFVQAKLSKDTFISKAPPELVEKEKEKLAALQGKLLEIAQAYERMKSIGGK